MNVYDSNDSYDVMIVVSMVYIEKSNVFQFILFENISMYRAMIINFLS